jgi:formylmethanofuran dehydrogenase subunit E
MASLSDLLEQSSALHQHLCPRQVLGVQMGRFAGDLLGLDLPQNDKRLLTIVETDGCFADGVAVATNCWVGRRTLRIEDYGKAAATFIDSHTRAAIRIAPHPGARHLAHEYAPEVHNRWEAMLLGYQRMELADLFVMQSVELLTPIEAIISRPGHRVNCAYCGEEILNEREVVREETILCRACAGEAYYRTAELLSPADEMGIALPNWMMERAAG